LHPGTNRLVTFDEIGQAQVHEIFDQTTENAPSLKDIQVAPLEINPVVGRGLYRTVDNKLIIWDAATEQLVCTMLGANDKKEFSVDWHPAIHRLVTRSADKVGYNDPDPPTLRVYNTSTGEKLLELPETWPRQIAPDGSSILTFKDETFTLHPLGRPGQPIDLPDPSTDDSQSSAAHGISPDGKIVALASSQGRIVLHSSNDGKLLREFNIPHDADKGFGQHSFSNLVFDPSGTKLLLSSNLESSYLIDLSTEKVTRAKDLQIDHGHDYEFQQDDSLLICPSYDDVELWSFPELELTTTIRSGADHLFLYPDEKLFLAWNTYGDCLLGSLETGIEAHTYKSPIAISAEHGLIATHEDDTLSILDFRTNKVLRSTPADSADDGLFSPDGRTLYFVDDNNALKKFTFHQDLPTLLQRARTEAPGP
jgi:WD40 repeat protein